MSDAIPIHRGLKQGDASTPLLFNFAPEDAISEVQDYHEKHSLKATPSPTRLACFWLVTS
jgi:hypothetical protein